MKNSAIEIIGYDKCTGCYGCLNTCPIDGAIEFKKTDEGFYKPFLTEICIQCGCCQKGCPVIFKTNNNKKEELEVYSCWSKDKEIVKNSSSGGIFSELAKAYLKNGDIVFGAKWDNGEIIHCGIDKIEDLKKLQKSKYLQSKIENSYLEAKKYLVDGKKVLFVGTPCEIAALNNIINHENLLTVDLVCHGIPSYKSYEKYIEENFDIEQKNIIVDFRNKDTGWENYEITFKNKNQILKTSNHSKNIWFRGFLMNVYLNTPCYNCEFRTMPRFADITLGDFWGVPEELKNINGTSVMTLNSLKGKEFFEKIKDNIEYKNATWDIALKGNPCLYNYEMTKYNRKEFFENIENKPFLELYKLLFPFPNIIKRIKNKIIKLYRRLK